jgi:hypothetical protein
LLTQPDAALFRPVCPELKLAITSDRIAQNTNGSLFDRLTRLPPI